VPAVCQPAERYPEEGVEDREGSAIEEAELCVRQREVGLDVVGKDREDLPVDEIEQIDDGKDAERVPAVGGCAILQPRSVALPLHRLVRASGVASPVLDAGIGKTGAAQATTVAQTACEAFVGGIVARPAHRRVEAEAMRFLRN